MPEIRRPVRGSNLEIQKMRYCFFLIFLVVHFSGFGRVIIKGKIRHYDGKSLVYYCPTTEGIQVPYSYKIQPAFNGVFKIEYENIGLGTTQIFFKKLLFRFFHDTDANIYFEIDEDKIQWPKRAGGRLREAQWPIRDSVKRNATVVIKGDYARINNFYNRTLRVSYAVPREVGPDYYSQLISKADSPKKVRVILDSLVQIELNQIHHLPMPVNLENSDAGRKDSEIKEFLINEVHSFYGSMFLKGMNQKRQKQVEILMKDSTAALYMYNKQWETLIETFIFESKKNITPNAASFDYNEFIEYLSLTIGNYKIYHYPKNTTSLDEYVTKRLSGYDSLLFVDEKSALAYRISGLKLYLENQLFYSPALLSAIYELQMKYPGSKNIEHFTPQIEKLKDYLESSTQNFDQAMIIKTKFTSFNDLVKKLKGKNLLVDIWATWCGPCVEEFKYKDEIQSFIHGKPLHFLYISIDKPEWQDRWQQSIQFNKLTGYHFRADDQFIKDMWTVLGGEVGLIPRYALIDENGHVVVSTAARPSNHEKLKHQINQLLSQTD